MPNLESSSRPTAPPPALLPAPPGVERWLLALLLVAYGYYFNTWIGPNIAAHVDQAAAIVEDHTLAIDRFTARGTKHPNTCDWSIGRGHVYPAKAPGTAFATVPGYAALAPVLRAAGDEPLSGLGIRKIGILLNWPMNAVPSALAMVLLLRLTLALGIPLRAALFGVLAVALGTGYFAYATVLYAHTFAANLIIAAAALLLTGARTPSRAWVRAALAGALVGYAVVVDYPAAFGVLVLGGALAALRPREIPAFVAGGLGPLALLLLYHASAFGDPFTTAYAHQNPRFAAPDGSFLEVPHSGRILDVLFRPPRGLLSYSPVLALAPPGAYLAFREGSRERRALALAAPALLFLWLLLNACYRNWDGGWTSGPRFLVPALPLLAPLVALAFERARALGALLLAVSIANYVVIVATDVLANTLYRSPLVDYLYPSLLAGRSERGSLGNLLGSYGHASLLLFLAASGACALMLVRAVQRCGPGTQDRHP